MYLIRDSVITDVYALAKTLREADLQECLGYGVAPAKGLRRAYYEAFVKRTAVIDGVIAAMWGMRGDARSGNVGTALGHTAYAYLLTAPVIEKLPLAFFRETRREVRAMLDTHQRIESECAVSYLSAQRFLGMIGFSFDETIELPGGKFIRFHMQRGE